MNQIKLLNSNLLNYFKPKSFFLIFKFNVAFVLCDHVIGVTGNLFMVAEHLCAVTRPIVK